MGRICPKLHLSVTRSQSMHEKATIFLFSSCPLPPPPFFPFFFPFFFLFHFLSAIQVNVAGLEGSSSNVLNFVNYAIRVLFFLTSVPENDNECRIYPTASLDVEGGLESVGGIKSVQLMKLMVLCC